MPPESVTTDCGGDTPRVIQLVRDDDGEIVLRSTHPDRFCRVHAEGEHVAVSCSQCGGTVYVPEPDASTSWEEQIRYFGSCKHTPTCALRRSRQCLLLFLIALAVLVHDLTSRSTWWISIHERSRYAQALILALIPLVHQRQQSDATVGGNGPDDVVEQCSPAALACAEGGGWTMRVCRARQLYLDLSKIRNCAGRATWRARRYAFDRNCFDDGAFVVAPCQSTTRSVSILSDISARGSARTIHLQAEPPTTAGPVIPLEYDRTVLHVRDTYGAYYHRFAHDALSLFGTLCRLQMQPRAFSEAEEAWQPNTSTHHPTRSLLLLLDPFPAHDGYDWLWTLSLGNSQLDVHSYRQYHRRGHKPTLRLSNAVLLSGAARLLPFYEWSPAAPQLRAPPFASLRQFDHCSMSFALGVRTRLRLDEQPSRDRKEPPARHSGVRVLLVLRAPPARPPPPCSRALVNAAEIVAATQQLANRSSTPFTIRAYHPTGDAPLTQQLPTFAQADVLVGMHGAGLVNMAVMPPLSTVVEIFSHGHDSELYYMMAQAFGHTHVHFRNVHPELHQPCEYGRLDPFKYGNTVLRAQEIAPLLLRAVEAQARRRPPRD